MNTKSRLLGLAFASADILIELDQAGRITLAIGSPPAPDCPAPETWPGRPVFDFLGKASQAAFETAVEGLAVGVRSPTADVLLICDRERVRRARIRAFRLPELAPALSCAITFEGSPFTLAAPKSPPLLTGEGFLERARDTLDTAAAQRRLALAFVDVVGLDAATGDQAKRVTARVQAVLQAASIDGSCTTRLTAARFALLKSPDAGRDLAVEVREAGAIEGLDLSSHTSETPITAGADPVSILKALRFTIEGCLRDGGLDRPGQAFSEALANTLRDAARFRVMVKARQFALHYQPIVDLGSGMVHHFEALARFGDAGPAGAILMAEELGLIEEFDLAVLEKAIRKLRQPGNGLVKVAVNVSAASLATDAYIGALLQLTAAAPGDRRRLMIEVTETAALADIDAADRRLRAARKSGVKVCIDDFGAGSATFDYLRGLSVDAVKIDGAFIRDLETDPRARTLVTHLVELCGSLRLTTVAEMIETEAVAELVESLGVDYGQGWYFGRPAPQPVAALPDRSRAAPRRLGAVNSWG